VGRFSLANLSATMSGGPGRPSLMGPVGLMMPVGVG
jgi:hypothetical protein